MLDLHRADREILLRELEHRVFNNLQLVDSLLNHALRVYLNVPETTCLDETRSRIKLISQTLRRVYKASHLDRVALTTLLPHLLLDNQNLIPDLACFSGAELKFLHEPQHVPADLAQPMMLLFHELLLVSRRCSLSRLEAPIVIEVRTAPGDGLELLYSDPCYPGDPPWYLWCPKHQLALITVLASQLGGVVDRRHSFSFSLGLSIPRVVVNAHVET